MPPSSWRAPARLLGDIPQERRFFSVSDEAIRDATLEWTSWVVPLLACREGVAPVEPPADPVVLLRVETAATDTLLPGQTAQVQATARTLSGAAAPVPGVTFHSTSPQAITVTSTGLVTGVAPGQAHIVALLSTPGGTLSDSVSFVDGAPGARARPAARPA